MNTEIVRSTGDIRERRPRFPLRRQKTPEERRERLLVKGTVSIFSGAGLTLFLYFLTHAVNLHLPPDAIANIPFEVDPVVRVLWLVGLIPAFAGVGRLLAAMAIKVNKQETIADKLSEPVVRPVFKADTARDLDAPPSVTERTTNLLVNRES